MWTIYFEPARSAIAEAFHLKEFQPWSRDTILRYAASANGVEDLNRAISGFPAVALGSDSLPPSHRGAADQR